MMRLCISARPSLSSTSRLPHHLPLAFTNLHPAVALAMQQSPAVTRNGQTHKSNPSSTSETISPQTNSLQKVIVLTGPTAVGKSSTALRLCDRLDGELVSADSVQLYRRLDVGSNKPSSTERQQTPHHLIDIVNPKQNYTAGDFYRAARNATSDILSRRRVPIVAGGTMMYVRWFLHGKPATPRPPPHARQKAAEIVDSCEGDWQKAIDILAQSDPQRAQRLSRNDWYRLVRALEVVETTGIPMTSMPLVGGAPKAKGNREDGGVPRFDFDFRCFFLVDERRAMNRRIDTRCEHMILPVREDIDNAAGYMQCDVTGSVLINGSILTEVCSLLVEGQLSMEPASPCLAIGYRQTIAFLAHRALCHFADTPTSGALRQDDDAADAGALSAFRQYLDDFQQATRNYAKQQIAWFRKEAPFHWVRAGPQATDVIERLYRMSRAEYENVCEQEAEEQSEMKADMIAQGKGMKTYVTERVWLTRGSAAEARAVELAEKCARAMATAMNRTELERVLDVVIR